MIRIPTLQSKFSFRFEDNVCIIIDQDGRRSVTNDMENVLEHIQSGGVSLAPPMRIIYRDSQGIYDQVIYENRQVTFVSLNKRSESEALQAVTQKP